MIVVLEEREQLAKSDLGNEDTPPPVMDGRIGHFKLDSLRHHALYPLDKDLAGLQPPLRIGPFLWREVFLDQEPVWLRQLALRLAVCPLQIGFPRFRRLRLQLCRQGVGCKRRDERTKR